jgi:hypothetical protein
MKPAPTLKDVQEIALYRSQCQYEVNHDAIIRMLAVVLAPSHHPYVRQTMRPALRYWDERSGEHIDFVWPGYSAYADDGTPDNEPVSGPSSWGRQDIPRYFSTLGFARFCRELRGRLPAWEYSGHLELCLLNVEYLPKLDTVTLDFGSALFIDLEMGLENGAWGGSIPTLFERIFDYAKSQPGNDPTWGFQVSREGHPTRQPLWGLAKSLIPRDIVGLYGLEQIIRSFIG